MESLPASAVDGLVRRLAARQHGVLAARQLLAAGAARGAVEYRVRAGRLLRVHRGVYALGHRSLTADGYRMAAVLRIGPDAALSHRSAGAAWDLPVTASRQELVCPRHVARIAGFRVHRTALPADEITTRHGVPLTTVARTLFDLAADLRRYRVERLIAEAERLELGSPTSLPALLARYPRRPGAPALRGALARLGLHGPARTRSDLEARLLDALDRHGLPRPLVNVPLETGAGRFECDFVFAGPRLVIELDTFLTHGDRAAFYRDRERDRSLHAAGWTVARLTDRDLARDPADLGRRLRALPGS